MAFSYGFFNSHDGDRTYSAKEFGSIFDGVIKDGVYGSIGQRLTVTSPEDGFKVKVGTGRAWVLHTWTLNTSAYYVTVSSPEVLLDRYDAVCLDVNHNDTIRSNSIKIKKGTFTVQPSSTTKTVSELNSLFSFENTDEHKEMPLGYVRVRAKSTHISAGDVINAVGSSKCPLVTWPLEEFTVDDLINQFSVSFTQWFEHLQYELDGDVAGHLQRQIDEIAKFKNVYVVDKVLFLPITAASVSGKKLIFVQ